MSACGARERTETYGWLARGRLILSVREAAFEAAAGCAGDRYAVSPRSQLRGLLMGCYGSQAGETETTNGVSRCHFKLRAQHPIGRGVGSVMPRIKQRDKALEDQLRRAASSIGLNAAEAAFSDLVIGGRGYLRLRGARGRRGMRCARLSLALGDRGGGTGCNELVERIVGDLWRMTRG